jgi:hypothetical protein
VVGAVVKSVVTDTVVCDTAGVGVAAGTGSGLVAHPAMSRHERIARESTTKMSRFMSRGLFVSVFLISAWISGP